jgi:hypothetical protein
VEVHGEHYAQASLPLGLEPLHTHWIRGCAALRTGLDTVVQAKFVAFAGNWTLVNPVWASDCSDRAAVTPAVGWCSGNASRLVFGPFIPLSKWFAVAQWGCSCFHQLSYRLTLCSQPHWQCRKSGVLARARKTSCVTVCAERIQWNHHLIYVRGPEYLSTKLRKILNGGKFNRDHLAWDYWNWISNEGKSYVEKYWVMFDCSFSCDCTFTHVFQFHLSHLFCITAPSAVSMGDACV